MTASFLIKCDKDGPSDFAVYHELVARSKTRSNSVALCEALYEFLNLNNIDEEPLGFMDNRIA